MNRWLGTLLCGLLLGVMWSPPAAAAKPASGAGVDDQFLTVNGSPTRVDFDGAGTERLLDFAASAGETLRVQVSGGSFADVCAVQLSVVDANGRAVAPPSCAAGSGQVAAVTVAASGTYRLRLRPPAGQAGTVRVALRAPARPAAVQPLDCAVAPLALDTQVDGSWAADCASVSLPGHYAQYYGITVPATGVISISLGSTVNSYLVLHSGTSISGPVVAVDDNRGPGLDALIARSLPAGDYTIEATTSAGGQTGSFKLAARTNSAPCFAKLKLNKVADSAWVTECESATFDDHYARYYTLSVPSDEVVTITLSSATNAYLVLRAGASQFGPVVAQDDNGGPGLDAQILRVLPAGVYTIEATTSAGGQLGSFSLVARTDEKPCFAKLSLDVTASSAWSTACSSAYFPDHYAKYYTLTVPKGKIVTISLHSATNAFLVLRAGPDQLSPVLATDDNSGAGLDARILQTLAAGTYTIEATTTAGGQLGDFDLTARTNTAPCFQAVPLDTVVSDQWNTECTSVSFDDHYARYYTLVVPSDQIVTITLSSATNAYLVLRAGATQLGATVASDDNSGPGLDARIAQRLRAGTYNVEVTTTAGGQLGAYQLTARTNSTPCFQALPLDTAVPDTWTTACSSVSFDDHYAKYYTLNVDQGQIVTLALSSATNAYLVLRSGPDQFSPELAEDDNSGAGLDARIIRWLDAGTYLVEATTTAGSQLGGYSLSARTNSAPCFAPVGLVSQTNGAWAAECTSASFDDHYAKYYTLTVPTDQHVTILLQSATNAYLVLRLGNDQTGPLVVQDDNSGGGLNAQIAGVLPAGVYTIEATTTAGGQMGSFTLTVAP